MSTPSSGVLTEIYIEALDEELADRVWEIWDKGEIQTNTAAAAWLLIAAVLRESRGGLGCRIVSAN